MKKLNLDEVKKITAGAVDVCLSDNAIRFNKCTTKQIDAWYAVNNDLGMRSCTTTGVRLDFHTNSKNLYFKIASGTKFELLIDEALTKRFLFNSDTEKAVSVPLTDIRGKEKADIRVTLALPSHSVGALEYIGLDDGAYVNPSILQIASHTIFQVYVGLS